VRNIEALRNYFLGKDPQLEVVLSDNSLRLCGIEGKHYILRGELIKRLTDLREAMEEADETLQANIDAEALARSQEDNALDGKITQEATTRAGADGALQNAINTVAGNLSTLAGNVYTKAQVDYLINEIPKFDIEIVQSLPTQDISTTTIYLVPNGDNPLSGNGYEEYIYINNNWELIGTTNIDLSDYYTKEEVDELIEENSDIKELTSPVTIWDLEDGVYLLPASCEVRYGGGMYWPASAALLFVGTENATTKRYFIFDGSGTQNTITNGKTTSSSGTIKYFSVGLDYEVAANKTATAPNSQSTNTQYPTSKAVYDFGVNNFIGNNVITDIWHGTQAQYEQISPKSATTLYLIDEE